jgi:hypothetical protein
MITTHVRTESDIELPPEEMPCVCSDCGYEHDGECPGAYNDNDESEAS